MKVTECHAFISQLKNASASNSLYLTEIQEQGSLRYALTAKSDTCLRTADICRIASIVIQVASNYGKETVFLEEKTTLLKGLAESVSAYEERFSNAVKSRFWTYILRLICFCYVPKCHKELLALNQQCTALKKIYCDSDKPQTSQVFVTEVAPKDDPELMAFVQKHAAYKNAPALFNVYYEAIRNPLFFDSLAQKYGFELLDDYEKDQLTYHAIRANAPSSMIEQLVKAGGRLDQDADSWDPNVDSWSYRVPLIHLAIDAEAWNSVDYLIKKMPGLLSVQKGYTGSGCLNDPKKWLGPTVEERLKARG